MNQEAVVLTPNFKEHSTEDKSVKASTIPESQTIKDCVAAALHQYFSQVDEKDVSDIYEMVLAEVEAPLLEAVMQYTRKNQTKASKILGLNRGTLRKKLKQYDML